MDDNDNFDEFDEFRNFDRNELNRLFRERMQDEDFRKRFMGIVGGYQRDFEGIMRLLYGKNNNPFHDPFSGLSSSFNPSKDSFFKGLDMSAFNEDGWQGEHWSSEDGHTHISSFSRSFTPEEFYNSEKRNRTEDGSLPASVVIELLETKLADALEEEKYEDAVSLRDTIKSLKEGEKSKNDDNLEIN
jgi:hypothetical protein